MTDEDERAERIRLIRDSAAAIASRRDLRRIRALRQAPPGFDPEVWRQMAEMGWPGLRVPEAGGGSGLGMPEFCALAEELGAGLVPEPLIGAALAAELLEGRQLDALLDGTRLVLPAWQERPNALDPGDGTSLRHGRLTGRKMFVHMGAGAQDFLVATSDGLALVAWDAPGVSLALAPTQDGGHFATVTVEGAPAQPIPGAIAPALEAAALATAAYLLGVMDQAFALTLDYLRTRQQFGRPIGSFQALQHRMADLKIQLELTRASVAAAALAFDTLPHGPARQAAVSRAKARASEAAMLVTRQAIQLHGGIGYTDEADIGLFLRKAMTLASLYGSPALHRARYAALAPEDDEP